ncbi:SDR family oxidoreductase [Paraburkholderia sp. J12]|uniref:SDR family oxidoreductase n=1 Tax=Paraburkholderia sp. J12 TaxID=2805432 RepID=UPI002ABDE5C0|nr:SDR family oxidoreductase [Paraburkholderia sp. J12]
MNAIAGQRLLVIGGSSGIGLATARRAAAEGAQVTIASRSGERLRSALADLPEGVRAAQLDVLDEAAVERYFDDEAEWDHVVVSGAETPMGAVRVLPLDAAELAMRSKFWGAYFVARAAKIPRHGSLTLVSGILSTRPRPATGLQSAINAALESLGRGLALELAPVRVNTVSPGIIATPLWDAMDPAEREAMYARQTHRLPVGRVGTPEDVAAAILFVSSNGFATGTTVHVDGGGLVAV